MELLWWHWAVFGIALMMVELAVPTFLPFWFGLGALLVALLLLVSPGTDLTAQILVWTLASVVMVFLWFKIFRPGMHKTRVGMSSANVLGEVGMLIKDVAPFQKGQVRFQKPLIGAEVWDCIADEAIKAGDRVKVVNVEGSLLKVGKVH